MIPNNDFRLYGWIDDVYVDASGKSHYLVCFGFLSHHKIKYLPNPETLKIKNEQLATLPSKGLGYS